MDRDEFIEKQVAFQFGECHAASGLDIAELVRARAQDQKSLVLHDPIAQSFTPAKRGVGLERVDDCEWKSTLSRHDDGWNARRALRNADMLSGLYRSRLKSPVMIDMGDANGETGFPFPVFQYNRQKGTKNAILWPLERIHKIGGTGFCFPPDLSESAFAAKTPTVFWRGGLKGFSSFGGKIDSVRHIVGAFLIKAIDEDTLIAHLTTMPRYAFVARYFDVPGFDVGFSFENSKTSFRQIPALARYEKTYVPREEQLGHRYHVSISGTDVASNFGWLIGTNCTILREPYPWEIFFDGHFAPWKHYVPIAADFADVPEKIEWCENNPEACQTMIEKRHELAGFLLEPGTRRKALRRVIRRYEEFYRAWAAS